MSAQYAAADRNWASIDTVVGIARQTGVTPAQVALSWMIDKPAATAPVVGARKVEQLQENLGAAGLHLDADATAVPDEVSAPQPGGYPYGAFSSGQRARSLSEIDEQQELVGRGSDATLGRR